MEDIVVLISAGQEWHGVLEIYTNVHTSSSTYGDWFQTEILVAGRPKSILFLHGGWGKIAAAASTQYAIDRWHPELLVNLGTCGGFEGEVAREAVILAERTLVYDIFEQMGDAAEGVAHYATDLDLTWLKRAETPHPVVRTLLVSGDRDLMAEDIEGLRSRYGAVAGDWESGAIAYVAARNNVPVIILRGVSDLVGLTGGEAYGNKALFNLAARRIMRHLLATLPDWLTLYEQGKREKMPEEES